MFFSKLSAVSFLFLVFLISTAAVAKPHPHPIPVNTFKKCEQVATKLIETEAYAADVATPMSELVSFEKDGSLTIHQHPAIIEDNWTNGEVMVMRRHPSGGSVDEDYIYFDFSKDAAGKVVGLTIANNKTLYFTVNFAVDDAKNTCVVKNASSAQISGLDFDLQTCGHALANGQGDLKSFCRGPDFLIDYVKRLNSTH